MWRWLKLAATLAATFCVCASASAEDFPTRPIHMIVGYPAGGVADVTARVLAERLRDVLGQPIVVENRPGASGTIAANVVAKAAPDGYTLLLTPSDFITMPSLAPEMAFDPNRDLLPIAMVTSTPLLVAASADAPFTNPKEMIAFAKKNGDLQFATPGTGSIDHVAGAWLGIEAKIKMTHVPYRGGPATANALATGEVKVGVVSPSSVKGLIDGHKVKAIALTGKNRPAALPASWPTLAENGIDVDAVLWNGVFAPAATPRPVVDIISNGITRALRDNAVKARLNALGIDVDLVIGEALQEKLATETARYTEIINKTGIKLDR